MVTLFFGGADKMSMMKEISDACLTVRVVVGGFLVAAVVVGLSAGYIYSSAWIGSGLGVASGAIAAWLLSRGSYWHS